MSIKNRHIDPWNRTVYPDISPHTYGHLILDKEAKNTYCRKESFFSKWSRSCWMASCRGIQIDPYLSHHRKLNSKWTKDLNIKLGTLNPTWEIWEWVWTHWSRTGLVNRTLKPKEVKSTINKCKKEDRKIIRARGHGWVQGSSFCQTQQDWFIYELTETVQMHSKPAQVQARWRSQGWEGEMDPCYHQEAICNCYLLVKGNSAFSRSVPTTLEG